MPYYSIENLMPVCMYKGCSIQFWKTPYLMRKQIYFEQYILKNAPMCGVGIAANTLLKCNLYKLQVNNVICNFLNKCNKYSSKLLSQFHRCSE